MKIFARKTKPATAQGKPRKSRAQSLVETALILPILMLLFGVLVDAGIALNAWLRVNTAARDATRFALDAGSTGDIESLVLDKLKGLEGDSIDIYIIKGATDNTGAINPPCSGPYWIIIDHYGTRTDTDPTCPTLAQPNLTRSQIQSSLATSPTANKSMYFVAVEVDLNYTPLVGNLIAPNLKIPMSSYAIIQRPPN